MIFDNQLRYAVSIIETYKGEMPLHTWLKNFFRENKQMGARDRRTLSTLVYGYYRLGHSLPTTQTPERLLAGLFLCTNQPGDFLQHFHPELNEKVTLPLEEKIAFIQTQPSGAAFRVTDIFPWPDQLSEAIDHHAFCLSFLRQPDLFLRIRPGHEKTVRQKLSAFPHEFIPPFTLRLPNGFKVEEYFTPDHEVVIQDYSSQRIASFFPAATAPITFWDACAASGGKSILAHDLYPAIAITVSDIRESILRNLQKRFQQAGIKKYRSFIADLTEPSNTQPSNTRPEDFDLILVDAPCTGSGTWCRTPEELYFFDPQKIGYYTEIQKKILSHIAKNLAPGSCLIYSTCSVFKKENEEIATFLRENFGLQQDLMENIKGYDHRADTMFAATLRPARKI
jgi:16S rRNA (cytosine967-C5)-methyltransferase